MKMAWLALLPVLGCAQTSPAEFDTRPDHGQLMFADLSPQPLADFALQQNAGDLATHAVADGGTPAGNASDLATVSYGDGGACGPKVNEVQTSTTASGYFEFVEIYNPCPDLYLDGWSIVYRSASNVAARDGNDSETLYSFGHVQLKNAHYLVYAGSAFTGASDGALTGSGIADDGAVGLRDAASKLVDSVGFGAVDSGNAFVETAPVTKAPRVASPGKSIARVHDGVDSNDNAVDFVAGTPTPGAAN